MERCDGVLLTGGDDIDPKIYAGQAAAQAGQNRRAAGAGAGRLGIATLIAGAFQQRKPLFGICRGHQMLNVALGGTLLVDIAAQGPGR